MPSNKIYTILVLCVGVIISVWLLAKQPEVTGPNTVSVSVASGNPIDTEGKATAGVTADWQNILVKLDSNSQITTNVVPKGGEPDGETAFNDTTLTAQMAKDFFARYLSIANSGDVTSEDANAIANSVLSSPEYTKTTGAVYTSLNLHINPKTDTETVKKYLDDLNKMIQNRGINDNNDDPMSIVSKAVQSKNETELLKIDPIISKARGVISDLVSISVPGDAITVHLDLLNASSNLLSNLEAMRVTFTDPVRSFAGASQYTEHIVDFQNALVNMRLYLAKKLGVLN